MARDMLGGTSCVAWQSVRSRFGGLLKITALPLLALCALYLVYSLPALKIFSLAMSLSEAGDTAQFTRQVLIAQAVSMAGAIAMLFAGSWLCVRIVRLDLLGETPVLGLNRFSLMQSLMWLLYGIGCYLISAFAAFVALLPLGLLAAVAYFSISAFALDVPGVLFAGIAGGIFATVWLTVLSIFLVRLVPGLPFVACGEYPDFHREMWLATRGHTWALSWRICLALAVYALIAQGILAVFVAGDVVAVFKLATDIGQTQNSESLAAMMSQLRQMMLHAFQGQAVVALLSIPMLWLALAWLCEIHRRIYGNAEKANLTGD